MSFKDQLIPIVKQLLEEFYDKPVAAATNLAPQIIVQQLGSKRPKKAISYTKTMTLADTEYEIPFPAGTKMFSIRMRSTAYSWRYSYEQSRVAPPIEPYSTVPASAEYYEKDVDISSGIKLFVGSATAAQVLECTFWV